MAYVYGLSEGVVLRADPADLAATLEAWIKGRWTTYSTIDKDWIERLPISARRAADLTKRDEHGPATPAPRPDTPN